MSVTGEFSCFVTSPKAKLCELTYSVNRLLHRELEGAYETHTYMMKYL